MSGSRRVERTRGVPDRRSDESTPSIDQPDHAPGDDHRLLLQSARYAGNAATARLARRLREEQRDDAPLMGGRVVDRLYAGTPAGSQTLQRAKVKHTTGKEVDTYASAHPFIKGYVASKIKGGTKAEGHVHIHTPSAFKKEWVKYAMSRRNAATGSKYTKSEAEAAEPSINAFRDGSEIHLHNERGETGTAIHESMHLYSHNTFRGTLGSNANEGTTEYFAREIMTEQKIVRGNFYPNQLASITTLIGASSKSKLAGGYFEGTLKGLKSDVEGKGEGNWASWIDFMKKGKYSDADALL